VFSGEGHEGALAARLVKESRAQELADGAVNFFEVRPVIY
jgi:hypothetical protein